VVKSALDFAANLHPHVVVQDAIAPSRVPVAWCVTPLEVFLTNRTSGGTLSAEGARAELRALSTEISEHVLFYRRGLVGQ
jgi:hypothetical protein